MNNAVKNIRAMARGYHDRNMAQPSLLRDLVAIADEIEATDVHALRLQLATCHEAIGAARALLHELDASGNYPHSSTAIGLVLMALEEAVK